MTSAAQVATVGPMRAATRFVQTLLNEWAYGRIYGSSPERTAQLDPWLDRYNYRRPHGSLSHQPPASPAR